MSKTKFERNNKNSFYYRRTQNTRFKKYRKNSQVQEEQTKNKFDYNYTSNNGFHNNYNLIFDSRKYSVDSSNLSTSNEDFSEHDSCQSSQKNKGNKNFIFKGKASDFKIKYKTELCKNYEMTGTCKFGDSCAFSHGVENLRSKVTNTTAYRTKKCMKFFEKGYCPYGSRCQFQHQLKNNIINNPYDKGMSYNKILETISKPENIINIKKIVEKPRLKIFKEILPENENNKSRLLDDLKVVIKKENEFGKDDEDFDYLNILGYLDI